MSDLDIAPKSYAILENRGLFAVTGEDAVTFLQGIVSNDVKKVSESCALYSAFLTAQGKFLHDFFMTQVDEAIVFDCEGPRQSDLMKRLKMYKLRSKVALANWNEDHVSAVIFGDGALEALGLTAETGSTKAVDAGIVYTDPRLPAIGARAILKKDAAQAFLEGAGLSAASADGYDALRISLGLPDGSRDMTVEKSILLENGFNELNGVDWDKGCYMGQELTARTKYRALIKKRLLPVAAENGELASGDVVMAGEKSAGEILSTAGGQALALLKLDAIDQSAALTVNSNPVSVAIPDWVVIEKPKDST